ncbi:MAG: hypothetical protein SCARUB_03487 [Candidatus Scalindua rubra]|uniref:TIR domain-containing protein n=1 Tax=Candidatus Scalindua rubra TaxID=1872076 RepID=A0A1E3X753_9BACT|nr:MAG: hypothetical protein SCARUB_03487 [Candidatus Scalindua rubra]
MDTKTILPGQRWRVAIREAIRTSNFVLALLSSNSVTKRGYVQKEIREALDIIDQLPDSRSFLIPVRLEICSPEHERLEEIHRVDLFASWEKGMEKILSTIGVSPPIELGYVDKLDAHVTNLRFFESGYYKKAPKKFTYQNTIRRHIWPLDTIQIHLIPPCLPVRRMPACRTDRAGGPSGMLF